MSVVQSEVTDMLNRGEEQGGICACCFTPRELAQDLMCYCAAYDGTEPPFDPGNSEHVVELEKACLEWVKSKQQ